MTRLFFLAAALYEFAWVAILLLRPERIMVNMPPSMAPTIALIAAIGIAFLACAVKVRRWVLTLAILGKLSGPPNFVIAVSLGYLSWSQWWMPVVNDILWLPPLVMAWRAAGRAPAP